MPEVIQWGGLLVKGQWLSALLGILAAYLVIQWRYRKLPEFKGISDIYINSVFTVLMVWKLSPIIWQPSLITRPLYLLYLNGDWRGLVIGVLIAVVYSSYDLRKKGILPRLYVDVISMPALAGWLIYSMLTPKLGKVTNVPWGISVSSDIAYHPIHYYEACIALAALLATRLVQAGTGRRISIALGIVGVGLWTVSFWSRTYEWYYGLSLSQWIGIAAIVIGFLCWPGKGNTIDEKSEAI